MQFENTYIKFGIFTYISRPKNPFEMLMIDFDFMKKKCSPDIGKEYVKDLWNSIHFVPKSVEKEHL